MKVAAKLKAACSKLKNKFKRSGTMSNGRTVTEETPLRGTATQPKESTKLKAFSMLFGGGY